MDNVMFDHIPAFFKTAENFKIFLDSEIVQYNKVEDFIKDVIDQLYIDTSTWGLIYWEKDYGLEYNSMLSYEERRSRIKAKLRGIGKVDRKLLATIAAAYSNGEVDVGFDGNINITFVGARGIPSAIDELKKQLEEIRPSGLPIIYHFTYLTWDELEQLSADFQETMTWDELEVYKL